MIFNYQGIEIADISTYQDAPGIPGHVDFHKMKDWGFRAVGIKAGQGDFRDPDFDTHWNGARGILPRFSYFFYDNLFDPFKQANNYWGIIQGEREGPCVVDLEHRPADPYIWRKWYDFLELFKHLSKLPSDWIWIYTGHYYFEEFTMSATDYQREYFKQYPLWLAAYTQDPFKPNYPDLRVPRPWSTCILLQSGTPAIGLAAGVESKELDYNQMNGGEDVFAKYFGNVAPEPEPTPEPEPGGSMKGVVKTGFTLKIRDGAGNDTGKSLRAGDTVYGPVIANRIYYFHVYRANGTLEQQAGNSATRDATTAWMTLTDEAEPGPNPNPDPAPEPSLPAYFKAYDAAGNELGRYNKQ